MAFLYCHHIGCTVVSRTAALRDRLSFQKAAEVFDVEYGMEPKQQQRYVNATFPNAREKQHSILVYWKDWRSIKGVVCIQRSPSKISLDVAFRVQNGNTTCTIHHLFGKITLVGVRLLLQRLQ
jgi:hypothetical protein